MAQTAENVAAKLKLSISEQHEVVLMRTAQYQAALADDHAFQKPFSIPKPNFKGEAGTLPGDEGVALSTAAGLAKLKPVLPNGTLTYGSQTHPADGNAAIIVASSDRARELSKPRDPHPAARFRPSARRFGVHAGGARAGGTGAAQRGHHARTGAQRQIAQPLCGERSVLLPRHRLTDT